MDKNLECILCSATKEYTIKKIIALLKKSVEQFDDYSDSLIKSVNDIYYENEYINKVEEAEVDNPLHEKLPELESILISLKDSTNKEDITDTLKKAYTEFSCCNICVIKYPDYLNVDELKKNLKSIILSSCNDEKKANDIVNNWMNFLLR